MLDAKIANAIKKMVARNDFREKVFIEEQKALNENRFLRRRQIAIKIYDYFPGHRYRRVCFGVALGNNVQGFDGKWDEAVLSLKKFPKDVILENMNKMRLRDSERLKSTFALYTQDTVEKGEEPSCT